LNHFASDVKVTKGRLVVLLGFCVLSPELNEAIRHGEEEGGAGKRPETAIVARGIPRKCDETAY
jgi:hypothetical protein